MADNNPNDFLLVVGKPPTKPAILSYPALFKPKPKHTKTPNVLTYQATIIFPPDYDLAPIRACMERTKQKMERKGVMNPGRRIKETMSEHGNPLHKSEDRAKADDNGKLVLPRGYLPGGHYITLHATERPTLVDERVQPVIDEAKFYAGCYCVFHIGCFVWENSGKWGLSFGLNGVQFARDGERLGGRPDVTSQFAPLEGETPPAAAGAVSDQDGLFN
jgi:hypothetical protein